MKYLQNSTSSHVTWPWTICAVITCEANQWSSIAGFIKLLFWSTDFQDPQWSKCELQLAVTYENETLLASDFSFIQSSFSFVASFSNLRKMPVKRPWSSSKNISFMPSLHFKSHREIFMSLKTCWFQWNFKSQKILGNRTRGNSKCKQQTSILRDRRMLDMKSTLSDARNESGPRFRIMSHCIILSLWWRYETASLLRSRSGPVSCWTLKQRTMFLLLESIKQTCWIYQIDNVMVWACTKSWSIPILVTLWFQFLESIHQSCVLAKHYSEMKTGNIQTEYVRSCRQSMVPSRWNWVRIQVAVFEDTIWHFSAMPESVTILDKIDPSSQLHKS